MTYDILQSSTQSPLLFFLVLSSDHITGATGKTPTVTISKAGAAFASPAGAVTEIGSGWYKVAGNATDTNTLGPLALHATEASSDPCDIVVANIVAYNPQDAVHLGLSALPNTACTTNASLLTSGSGTDQLSVSSGKVILQATQTGVTIPTVTTVTNQLTAAQIATGVWQDTTAGDFTVASSIGKSLYTSGNAPGAASGLALVGSNMGSASSVTAGVTVSTNNDKTGYSLSQAFPANFSSLAISGGGAVTVGTVNATASNIKKNTALSGFMFLMTDSTNHAPATGLTVSGTVSLDGGVFGALTNAVSEVSNGWYKINLAAADLNGNNVALRFTATGADDRDIYLLTQP